MTKLERSLIARLVHCGVKWIPGLYGSWEAREHRSRLIDELLEGKTLIVIMKKDRLFTLTYPQRIQELFDLKDHPGLSQSDDNE